MVRNTWRAKELVWILNRHDHCISYEKSLEIDSDWGERIQSMGANPYTAIPANIILRVFLQATADNTDSNLDNLDGKDLVHITSLALYQDKAASIEPGNHIPEEEKKLNRSLRWKTS